MRWIFFKETMIKINIKIIIRLNRIRREEISRGRYCTVLFKKRREKWENERNGIFRETREERTNRGG